MKKLLLYLSFLISILGQSQQDNYYLFDSINISEIDSIDLNIIDSCFTVYYADPIDTNKANALAHITNSIQYEKWYFSYFQKRMV